MGPRIRVDQDTFLAEISKIHGPVKVIKGPKVLWQGCLYLFRGDDYYYYTITKEELAFPETVEVTSAAQILL